MRAIQCAADMLLPMQLCAFVSVVGNLVHCRITEFTKMKACQHTW